jgi:tetratricopeptide (TPR) repeat protein
VCEEAAEKPVRALNAGQEAVRAGVLQLQAAKTPVSKKRAHEDLGWAYYGLSDYRQAIEHFEQQLTIARELCERRAEGHAYTNLGATYDDLAEHPRAIALLKKGLRIAREVGDRSGEAGAASWATSTTPSESTSARSNTSSDTWRSRLRWATAMARAMRAGTSAARIRPSETTTAQASTARRPTAELGGGGGELGSGGT